MTCRRLTPKNLSRTIKNNYNLKHDNILTRYTKAYLASAWYVPVLLKITPIQNIPFRSLETIVPSEISEAKIIYKVLTELIQLKT